ncbi:hypothetical protein ANACOL_01624 [Anaerotruncus colihominis DSM 17241]|uniref:Uncharacterized protein n=1 Tax=Anaerotruncus colihominis DSM 17241 TaxID=445972 RepID=B0PA55_9FIRM|nr:hypothetical protein ANACOL_01624 [Anaerotruncus colihominis DSM 17241]
MHSDGLRPNAKNGGKHPDSRCKKQRESGRCLRIFMAAAPPLKFIPGPN